MGVVGKAGTFGALRWKAPYWSVHTGADLNAPLTDPAERIGIPVYAIARGRVVQVSAADVKEYGLRIVIQHAGGVQSLYAHLYRALVKAGETVSPGEQIAVSGQSGNAADSSEPAHLHFELSNGNPLIYPNSASGVVIHDNVVNPCAGQTSTGGAVVSVYGNVRVTSAALDDTPLPRIAPNSFRVSHWSVGVSNSHKEQNLSHVLELRTRALCDGVYSVGIAPDVGGLVYQYKTSETMPLVTANVRNGDGFRSAVVVFQNPGFHEALLASQPSPTPAPACSSRPPATLRRRNG
ncbi:MAG TPA: M23 family metallopeptidase [Candidatus Acidoferrales bacterium]|nr:M23 family metallopeptidase [Candidatus Acidoferrales bacterium]